MNTKTLQVNFYDAALYVVQRCIISGVNQCKLTLNCKKQLYLQKITICSIVTHLDERSFLQNNLNDHGQNDSNNANQRHAPSDVICPSGKDVIPINRAAVVHQTEDDDGLEREKHSRESYTNERLAYSWISIYGTML